MGCDVYRMIANCWSEKYAHSKPDMDIKLYVIGSIYDYEYSRLSKIITNTSRKIQKSLKRTLSKTIYLLECKSASCILIAQHSFNFLMKLNNVKMRVGMYLI